MKRVIIFLFLSTFIISCSNKQTEPQVYYKKEELERRAKALYQDYNRVHLIHTVALGHWTSYVAADVNTAIDAVKVYQRIAEEFYWCKLLSRRVNVNYFSLYLHKVNRKIFQEKWGDLIQLDNVTGQYHIIPGKEKEFDQRQDDWAQQVSNAMRYPIISNDIPAPMRQAFNEAAKYQTITKVQKALQDQINSKPAVQRAKNNVDERLRQFNHTINSNPSLIGEFNAAGFKPQDALDLQRVMSKDSLTQQILTDFSKKLGNTGVVLKAGINGAWNLLTGDNQPTDMNFDAVRQKVINDLIPEIAQKTGVTNEKAIKYYINHWILHKDSALLGAMNDFGPYTGELAKVGVVDALDNYYKAQGAQYQQLGILPRGGWAVFEFENDNFRKCKLRQIMASIHASYPGKRIESVVIDGDGMEFKTLNPDDILSFSYNPLYAFEGKGIWRFGYKVAGGRLKYITIQMPYSITNGAIPYKGWEVPRVDLEIMKYMRYSGYGMDNNSPEDAIPFFWKNGRDDIPVRFTYSIFSRYGGYSAKVNMKKLGKWYTMPLIDDKTNEVILSNDPEDLAIALYRKGMDTHYWETAFAREGKECVE